RMAVKVVLDGAANSYDKCYSYFVPDNLLNQAKEGCRVTVPFGNGNMTKHGLILEKETIPDDPKIKYILKVLDGEPIIDEEMRTLCSYMKERLFCTYFDAINVILPAGLKLRLEEFYCLNREFVSDGLLKEDEQKVFEFIKENEPVLAKKVSDVCENHEEILKSLLKKQAVIKTSESKKTLNDKTAKYARIIDENGDFSGLSDRQKEVAEVIRTIGIVSVKEICYFTGASVSVINTLAKKGIIELFEKQIFRTPYKLKSKGKMTDIVLNDEQNVCYKKLKEKFEAKSGDVSLLYGVTGSGKTSVYMKLVDLCFKKGLGVIVMVPEIALTPQTVELFSNRYGDKIAVLHSDMSIGQRADEYKRLKEGKASIAIGTRSAVFAPVKNLGLIIMDEEQEHTYKSEKSPRFHARDIAYFRAKYNKCLLVLASATPSLESYSLALSGKYDLCEISKRYNDAKLPFVTVVDMQKELSEGNKSNISRLLASKIGERLQNKKQVILLLNRRGHNTHLSCPNCGYVAVCEDCSVSMTYHSANKRIMCHYCGKSQPVPTKCPECGNEFLKFSGAGTQKLEEEIKLLFPEAKILRLDADTTLARDSMSQGLKAFADGEYDIMIGTQMVAKGLDFPNVDLVGVLGADRAFYSDDFRGFERTFSLLTQVIGRAGRSGGESEAVVQTNNINDNVILLASTQDYKQFYDEEILSRQVMIYPPYCDICMVVASSENREIAETGAKTVKDEIVKKINGEFADVKLIILGPIPASVIKVNGKYRYRMLIKCKNNKRFREMLNESINIKKKKDLSVYVDINPETVL
ncbi:MAG: primosomal protein N', partial [Clostridia bacterium]|nr:primosomal protein N' [Clostridia bacterium]